MIPFREQKDNPLLADALERQHIVGQRNVDWYEPLLTFQPTGERYVDPTTQQLLEVFDNPGAGERDYREATK